MKLEDQFYLELFCKKKQNKLTFASLFNKRLPNIFPSFFMSRVFLKTLNFFYFTFSKSQKKYSSIDTFFYPLDKIDNWNIIYGKKGFISYQCSLPVKNSYNSIYEILEKLKKNKIYSFVSVLKSRKK